ncbi:winged helix-turn-helix transcriptional regulator [Streptomyces sp. NPDC059271]|uniref:winged helix-turn-helix transcriptional regulator n=1 Tax=Streptomyces sp. NPDC059271 TaxID=3346799 RepID=UPI0036B95797
MGDRWALIIIREIFFGNRRFSQIAKNTSAPRDRLSARLKSLMSHGIITRSEYQAGRYEYDLTPAGHELFPVLVSFIAWGDRWAVDAPSVVMEHHGHDVEAIAACRTCREELKIDQLNWHIQVPEWTLAGKRDSTPDPEPASEPDTE